MVGDYHRKWRHGKLLRTVRVVGEVYTHAGVVNTRGFYNFADDKGGVELGYTFYFNDILGVYLQGYHGYGETLIDYDHSQTRVGLGIKLMNL